MAARVGEILHIKLFPLGYEADSLGIDSGYKYLTFHWHTFCFVFEIIMVFHLMHAIKNPITEAYFHKTCQ